jgi:DUF4097 and DUF4098 domain-containing protein YvlB
MLLAAAARGEETQSRTERFNATLAPGATLRISNISGDVVAVPGRQFRAVVEIVATGPTRERAREVLDRARVIQSSSGDLYTLETRWPRTLLGWQRFDGRRLYRCAECKVTARYEVTVPPGVTARLETVNGEVRTRDVAGDLRLRTVNGRVEALGVRRSLDAQTVNGSLEAVAAVTAPESSYKLQTVNGTALLTLPKDARFDLAASTMNGSLASTFALPRSSDEWDVEEVTARPRAGRSSRRHRRIVVTEGAEDGVTVVDVKELEKELEKSLKDFEVEIQDSAREVRQIRILDPRRGYKGVVGGGGASVDLRSMNGAITLLASGTRESEAKPLVPQRRSFVVTVPEIQVKVPRIRIEPGPVFRIEGDARPAAVRGLGEVVRGDVSGNFLSTRGGSSYSIGNVSGAVKILSHSGEIRVASAGAGADLKTLGGDIKIESVQGDLRAHTGAGDIRAGTITGFLRAETSGGDIRVERVRGGAEARTAGGDIVLTSVAGPVQAETAGGLVRVGIVSPEIKGGVAIRNEGGDVSLTLPANLRANVELIVAGEALPNGERMVRSDFPELAVTRRQDGVYATGTLNGGGPRIVVRTTSGVIRLRKGAPAN